MDHSDTENARHVMELPEAAQPDPGAELVPAGRPVHHQDTLTLTQQDWEQYIYDLERGIADVTTVPPLPPPSQIKEAAAAFVPAGVVPIAVANLLYQAAGTQRAFIATALLPDRFDLFTPLPPVHYGKQVRFVVDEGLVFTNDENPLGSLSIDFADGNGPRTVSLGQTVDIRYQDATDKILRLRAEYGDRALETSFMFALADTSGTPDPDAQWRIRATIPYQDVYPQGTAYILYGSEAGVKHTSLVRPVLMADGFPGHSYQEIYDLLNAELFLTQLLDLGYDAVLLSYDNGSDYVQRNAFVAVQCIEQIKLNRAGQEKLIVGGGSMGGVITRYALAYMEQNGLQHDASLFFTFDSPHQGANIPLSDQFQILMLAEVTKDQESVKQKNLLSSPAARQMLAYNAISTAGTTSPVDPLHTAFYRELANLGYPQQCRKVGVANGSGDGQRIFPDFAETLDWGTNVVTPIYYYRGENWMLPARTLQNTQISYFQQLNADKIGNTYSYSVSNVSNYDNAPGGLRNSNGELAAALRKAVGRAGWVNSWWDDHCFIPTISALDIPTANQYAVVPATGATTPFDTYYVSTRNTAHVSITPEIAAFLLRQLPEHDFTAERDILQLWDNGGHPALTSYAPLKNGAGLAVKSTDTFTSAGVGAVAWRPGYRELSQQTDVFQAWDSSGQLGLTVYSPREDGQDGYRISFSNVFPNAGPGAVAWLTGHRALTDKADLYQIWNNNGQLGLTVYSPVDGTDDYHISSSQTFGNAGPGAVAWLTGRRQFTRLTDLFQIWDSNGQLGLTVYSPREDGQDGYRISFSQTLGNAGPGATTWLTGHRALTDKADLYQIWNNNGQLGLTVYSPVDGTDDYHISSSQTFDNAGPGAVAWLTGYQQPANNTVLFQIWNNEQQLALTVYAPRDIEADGYQIADSQTFTNAGPGAYAWLAVSGEKSEADLAQFWGAGDQLGLTVLTPDQKGRYDIAYTKHFPLRAFIAWFAAEGGLASGQGD